MTRWLVGVLLFACSSPRREPAPAVASGTAPPSAIDASASDTGVAVAADVIAPDADAAAGPARLARPAGACTLAGTWKHQPTELRLTAGGAPFADNVQAKRGEVVLGDTAFAELTTEAVRIAGYVDKTRLRVHAAKPFLVGNYAAPGPKLAMRFVSAADGKLAFELPLPAYAKAAAPPRGERACDELSLDDTTDFDPRDAIAFDAESEAYLYAKRAIPLSIEPGKPAAVTLRYETSPKVDVVEKQGSRARVAIEINSLNPAEHVVLFGWVPASALHTNAHGFGGSWATGGPRAARRGPPLRGAKRVACANELPLAVELAGERRTVGVVLANAVVEYVPSGDDLVEVRIAKTPAELAVGARWLVARAALAGCAAAP